MGYGETIANSTYNNSLGNDAKVDGVIIYSLIKLTNISSQPYINQTERKYKYHQMRDLITTTLTPFLVPKVSKDAWAKRYFTLMQELQNVNKLEQNLDYFRYVLSEFMQLMTAILYSNNYYMLENYTDQDYVRIMNEGGEVVGN